MEKQVKGSFHTLRICKIYDGDYPWDVRVEKILSTLVGKGYEVHLVCRNLAKRPGYEYLDKIHIHRLSYFKHDGLNSVLTFPAPVNPLWLIKIFRVVLQKKINLIIVRDLPLTLAGILVGKICRVPVVFDMAEDYPAMVRDIWKLNGFKLVNLIFRNPCILDVVETLCVRWVSGIITVVRESKNRLVDQYRINESKISIVSNTPRLAEVDVPQKKVIEVEQAALIKLIYVGGLENGRNVEVILEGMALLKENLSCSMTIIGKGETELYLKELSHKLNLSARVIFKGWIKHNLIGKYLVESDIGVIPHGSTNHTNTTVPNKLFDYMAYSKPVLASDTEPVRRIVESENCGIIYKHDSPEDFRDKLMQLIDLKTRNVMGNNGRKAVEQKYNWEEDSKNLLALMQRYPSTARTL